MAELLGNLDSMAEQSLLRRHGAEYGSVMKNRTLLDQLRSGARGGDAEATREALKEVSQEFEAVFLQQMVTAMRKTVGESGLIEKSNAEKMFEGMLDEEWARSLAGRHGPGGLSNMIYRELGRRLGLEETGAAVGVDAESTTQGTQSHPLLQLPAAMPPVGVSTGPTRSTEP
jgi:flagellar protein FlgJ